MDAPQQLEFDFDESVGYPPAPIPNIIAFTGKARSGKDTAAQFLQELGPYKRISFAEPLYDMLKVLVIDHMGEDQKYFTDAFKEHPIPFFYGLENEDISFRKLAQTLGTEWGRKLIDDQIWLEIAYRKIIDSDSPVVITDCRFPNEAELLYTLGAKIYRITREDATEVASHVSENGVPEEFITATIENNGTLEEFRLKLFWAIKSSTLSTEGKPLC